MLDQIDMEQESCKMLDTLKKKKDSKVSLCQTPTDEQLWYYHSGRDKPWKIYIPETLKTKMIDWYHENLQHPGKDCMIKTVGQHFSWPNWTSQIHQFVITCPVCQQNKLRGQ